MSFATYEELSAGEVPGSLALAFDDNGVASWTALRPLFSRYHARVTFFVTRYGWGYPLWLCLLATGFFILIDSTLFSAALLKIHDGGWFPLALGAAIFVVMATWRRGRAILATLAEAG